jgi:hypothetical protein
VRVLSEWPAAAATAGAADNVDRPITRPLATRVRMGARADAEPFRFGADRKPVGLTPDQSEIRITTTPKNPLRRDRGN